MTYGSFLYPPQIHLDFVKQTSLYHVILLIKIEGVLLLRMDLWRTPGASLVSDKV